MAPLTNTTYRIRSYAGVGKYLNIYGNEQVSSNRNVCLWSLDTSANAQKWNVQLHSTNVYKIITALNSSYGLNYYWSSGFGNPGNCDIYPHSGNADATVEFVDNPNDENIYRIKLTRSGTNLYLTAASDADGANVSWEYRNANTYAQDWKFEAIDTGGSGVNYAVYPTKHMNITQNHSGTFSHSNHSASTADYKDYPVDEACQSTTTRSYMYCPCDEMEIKRITGVGEDSTNAIWLQSTEKVYMPCGYDYLTMMIVHPNDDTLQNLYVGQKFDRGDPMFLEGDDGYTTGHHFHISTAKGTYTSSGWIENSLDAWVLYGCGTNIIISDAFYLDSSFTTVINSSTYTFTNKP